MNNYEILEVSQSASPETIKAAYRSLMQRFHPDKHPESLEIAEHASSVVQAYSILSDPIKRAAYDIMLKQSASVEANPGGTPTGAGGMPSGIDSSRQRISKEGNYFGMIWLLIVLIIASSFLVLTLMKGRQTQAPQPLQNTLEVDRFKQASSSGNPAESVATPVENSGGPGASQYGDTFSRIVPQYISGVTVYMAPDGKTTQAANRVLFIPVLGVKVGSFQAEKVLLYLENNKDGIRKKLEDRLVSAKYDELLKVDGEQYLKNMIMDAIDEYSGLDRHKDFPSTVDESPGRYGVVDLLLPVSFSLR